MIKRILNSFLATFLTVGLVVNCIGNSSELKEEKNNIVNNFFVLGDSLSDTGNICNLINEFGNSLEQFCKNSSFSNLIRSLSSNNDNNIIEKTIEYFKTFSLPKDYYKSSFSNGPVAAEIIAKKIGIKLNCAYKIDCSIKSPVSYKFLANKKGNNYAVAGSKSSYTKGLLKAISEFSIPSAYKTQFKDLGWKECFFQLFEDSFLNLISSIKKQTASLLEHHKISDKDLFFIEIGGNDVFAVYEKIKPNLYNKSVDVISIIEKENDNSVYNLKQSLELLIKNGAKKIMLANCVNVVNTPYANNLNEKNKNILENIVNSFNSKWNNMFTEFEYAHSSIFKKVDFNFICNKAIAQFDQKGLNITDPIADYNVEAFTEIIFGGAKEPTINAKTKEEKDKYFFFDLIHPSAIIHDFLAQELYKIYQTWNEKVK